MTLDIACGYPNGPEPYHKHGDIGIDILKGYADVLADAEHLPFKPNSFQTARISSALDHFKEPMKVVIRVSEIASTLEITTANSSYYEYGLNKHPKEHLYQWNRDILRNFLEVSGFQVFEERYSQDSGTWKAKSLQFFMRLLFRGKDLTPLFSKVIMVKARRLKV